MARNNFARLHVRFLDVQFRHAMKAETRGPCTAPGLNSIGHQATDLSTASVSKLSPRSKSFWPYFKGLNALCVLRIQIRKTSLYMPVCASGARGNASIANRLSVSHLRERAHSQAPSIPGETLRKPSEMLCLLQRQLPHHAFPILWWIAEGGRAWVASSLPDHRDRTSYLCR